MNKVILSALALLIVAQGIDSQISISLGLTGNVIVTVIASVISTFTSVIYGGFSLIGFTLSFQSPATYTTLVSPPNAIAIASIAASTIKTANPSLNTILTSISSQVSSVDTSTAGYYTTLSSATLNQRSISVASTAINLQSEATRRIGYLTLSLASIIGGRQPNANPFDTTLTAFTYPPLPTLLPLNSNQLGTSTVGQQSAAFSSFVASLIAHIKEFNQEFEDVRKQVGGGCSCPVSSNQTLVTSLQSLNSTIASFSKITTKTTLVQYWNSTVGLSVTNNFTAINSYLSQFDTCVKCLLTRIQTTGARGIKQYCNGKPAIDSTSAGVNDTSCVAHGLRAITRVINNANRDIDFTQSRARTAVSFLLQRISNSITTILANFGQAAANLKTNTSLVRASTFRTSLGPLQTALNNFQLAYRSSINTILSSFSANLTQFNNTVNGAALNATNTVSTAVVNLSQAIINSSDLYPCCTTYANSSLDVELKFANDLKLCSQTANNAVSAAGLQVINNLQFYGTAFNGFVNSFDACYNTVVNGWLILNSVLIFPLFSNKAMACVSAVTTTVTTTTSSIPSSGNTTLTSALANFPQASQTYQTCVSTAVSTALASLTNISTEYLACKRVGSCSSATTLNLQPNITALQTNLTSLLALANVSKADQVCVQSVIKDAKLLATDLQLLSTSNSQSSTSAQLSVLISLSASVDLINYRFSQCKIDNRTDFVQNITNIVGALATLQNATANSTAYAGCLNTIKAQITALQVSTTALNSSLFIVDYFTDKNATAQLEAQVAALNASWTECLNFDNRTLLLPNITNSLNTLYQLANQTSNSTAYSGCLLPIQEAITAMIDSTISFNQTIFNNTWSTDNQVVSDLVDQVAALNQTWTECLAFDNRTLLLPNVTDIGQKLADLLANVTNSTAYSGCLAPIQAQLAIDLELQVNLTTEIFNYTYDISAQMVADLELEITSLQAAFNACLIFDPYEALQSSIEQAGVDLTNMLAALANATYADPSCATPIYDQLTSDLTLQTNLPVTIYDYDPDVATSIVTNLQNEILTLQTALAACLAFDPYVEILQNITQAGIDLTNLQAAIDNSTADPLCTGPISDQIASDLQLQANLSSGIYDYPLDIVQQINDDLQAEILALQTAFNACLALIPFDALLPNITQAGIDLTDLQNALSNSTADRACVEPLLAQIEIDLQLQANLTLDFNDYSIEVASEMVLSLQNEITVLQTAANACLAFDPYAPLLPNITQAGEDLTNLVNTISNSTIDPSCSDPLLAQLDIYIELQSQLPNTIYNYTAEVATQIVTDLQTNIAALQAALDACIAFDFFSQFLPNITQAGVDLNNLQQAIANSTADPLCIGPISDQLTADLELQSSLPTTIFDYTPEIAQQIVDGLQAEILALQAAFNACQVIDFTQDLLANITQIETDLNNLQNAIANSTADPSCTGPLLAQISVDQQLLEALPTTINSYDLEIADAIVSSLQADILVLQTAFNACVAFDPYAALKPLINQTAVDLLAIENALLNSTADSACLLPIQAAIVQDMQAQLQLQTYLNDYPPDIAEAIVSDLQTHIQLLNASIQACIAFDPRVGLFDVINNVATNLTNIISQLTNNTALPVCASEIEITLSSVAELLVSVNSTILSLNYTDGLDLVSGLVQASAELQLAWTTCLNYDNRTDFFDDIDSIHANLTALADAIVLSGLNWPCVSDISKTFVHLYDLIVTTNSTIMFADYNTDLQAILGIQAAIDEAFKAWQSCVAYDPRVEVYDTLEDILGNLSALVNQIVNSTADVSCALPIEMTVSEVVQLAININSTVLNISLADDLSAVNDLQESLVSLQQAWNLCLNYDNRTEFFDVLAEAMANLTAIGENMTLSGLTWPCMCQMSQSFVATSDLINQVNSSILINDWTFDNETVSNVLQIIADIQKAWDACYSYDPRTEFFDVIDNALGNLSLIASQIVNSTADSSCSAPIEIALSEVAQVAISLNSTILDNPLSTDAEAVGNLTETVASLKQAWNLCLKYDNRTLFFDVLDDFKTILSNFGENITFSGLTWPCVGKVALTIVATNEVIEQVNATILLNNWTTDNSSIADIQKILEELQTAWNICYTYDPKSDLFDTVNDIMGNLSALAVQITNSTADPTCAAPIEIALSELAQSALSLNSTILDNPLATGIEVVTNFTQNVTSLKQAWSSCLKFDNRTLFIGILDKARANLTAIGENITSSGLKWSCVSEIALSFVAASDVIEQVNQTIFVLDWAADNNATAEVLELITNLKSAWDACYSYDPRSDLVPIINEISANLTAISQVVSTSNASATCLSSIQLTLSALFAASSSLQSTLFSTVFGDAKQAVTALTSSVINLNKSLEACQNYDNRTEFYLTTAEIKANLSEFAVSLLNSSASPICQEPIEAAYVQIYELNLSINSSILINNYTTDAQLIAQLLQSISDLHSSWTLCQSYNPLDDIASVNNKLIADLNSLIASVNATTNADPTCSAQVISDIQAFLGIVTNFNNTLYASNYTYYEAKNVSDSLNEGYVSLQQQWEACSGVSAVTPDPRLAVLQQISAIIKQIQDIEAAIPTSTYDPACLASVFTNCTEAVSLLQPVVDSGLSNDLAFLQNVLSLAQSSYTDLSNAFNGCSTATTSTTIIP